MIAAAVWIWAWVGPWAAWLWWAALAPTMQSLLHCCGIIWLGERAAKWWAGDN